MKKNFAFMFILFVAVETMAQLPAFPGAEGWGRNSIGGRGGTVVEVTNLNDSGPGSFREACNAAGPRTIVFRTGGIIELQSEIQITNPYVTIAAQTAPGDGILLKNFQISTFIHDIIIRGLRIRPGDENIHNGADVRDCLSIQTGSYNVIIDHCSFSWGIDENVSVWDNVTKVSLQWNIISEGLYHSIHPKGPHSMGLLIANGSNKISAHHNLFAHNNSRNPLVIGGTNLEFVNNVIYDWGTNSEFFENGSQLKIDIAGNYWRPKTSNVDTAEMPMQVDFDSTTTLGSSLYCTNNQYMGINFLNASQLQSMGGNAVLISATSLLDSASTVSFDAPLSAYDTVLAWTGALHPQRDTTDNRIIASVADSTGGLVDCMLANLILLDSGAVMYGTDSSIVYSQLFTNPAISAEGRQVVIVSGTGAGQIRLGMHINVIDTALRIVEAVVNSSWTVIPDSTSAYEVIVTCDNAVEGWPTYATGTPTADADHDGMPNSWELLHGLNPNDSTDGNGTTIDTTGYTNLEVYLNEFYNPNAVITVPEFRQQKNLFIIYPNPSKEKIIVETGFSNSYSLKLFDVSSREIMSSTFSSDKISLDISSLESGIYFLRVGDGERYSVKRFIKN
jgi:pectate lyase